MKLTRLPCSSAALLHPVTLLALALWAINDHLLQGWGPGVLTGKLSGVAGLVVCPTVLFGILEWCAPGAIRRHRRAALAASCAVLGLLVLGLELSGPVDLAYRQALGSAQFVAASVSAWLSGGAAPAYVLARTTPDVTDLLTLPALAVPWWLGFERRSHGRARELTLGFRAPLELLGLPALLGAVHGEACSSREPPQRSSARFRRRRRSQLALASPARPSAPGVAEPLDAARRLQKPPRSSGTGTLAL